ncbi:MAG TPA: response regulator [Planctomycetota bacterium]|nr:response regulator [Planctomycetota bacterium]
MTPRKHDIRPRPAAPADAPDRQRDYDRLHAALHELELTQEEVRAQNSQLQQARDQLEQSLARFTDLYDFAPVAYVTLDAHGMITDVNVAGARLLALARSLLFGHPFRLHVLEEDRPRFDGHLRRFRVEREGMTTELRLHTREGRTVPVELRSRRIDMSRAGTTFLTALIELTERKRAEQALMRNEERLRLLNERLAERTREAEQRALRLRELAWQLAHAEERERRRIAGLLHDHLQQLLFAARLKLARLQGITDGEQRERLLAQATELIEASVLASRSLTCELSPTILHESGLGAALQWLARQMKEQHGLEVDVRAGPDGPALEAEVRLVLFRSVRELLFNVIKHAGVERAELVLDHHSERVRIEVRDHGKGFDPSGFAGRRQDCSGLAGVRDRMQAIDGRLEITSAPGRGSSAVLVAPYARTAPAEPPPRSTRPHGQPRAIPGERGRRDGKLRVLLADDQDIVREGLASLLSAEPDIEVVAEAGNGAEALELARERDVDVVVMDVGMPILSGVEATRRIRAELPGVRVIGLSMNDEQSMAQTMLDAGASAYLSKSAPADALVSAVRTCRQRGSGAER